MVTLKGIVNLKSLARGGSIEMLAGKISSISESGELLSPTEFSGDLMRDFELAGKVMSENAAAGKPIELD